MDRAPKTPHHGFHPIFSSLEVIKYLTFLKVLEKEIGIPIQGQQKVKVKNVE